MPVSRFTESNILGASTVDVNDRPDSESAIIPTQSREEGSVEMNGLYKRRERGRSFPTSMHALVRHDHASAQSEFDCSSPSIHSSYDCFSRITYKRGEVK